MAYSNQQFETLKSKFDKAAKMFCDNEYKGKDISLIGAIADLQNYYTGSDASNQIADAVTFDGYDFDGLDLKTACANLFGAIAYFENGVNSNLWKILAGRSDV